MAHAQARRAFFDNVKASYATAQAKVHEPYQYLLYHVEHPLHPSTTDHIEQGFGLAGPRWTPATRQRAIDILDKSMHYPATQPIAQLPDVPGLTLEVLSHYLHFFHHAYPIYNEASVKGLHALGVRVPWTTARDPAVYALYIQAIEDLKEHVPFFDVPETNVYLTRIIQAALEGSGT